MGQKNGPFARRHRQHWLPGGRDALFRFVHPCLVTGPLSRHIGSLCGALCATSRGIYMPETESWVSRGTSPAVEAGDCLGPISERRRYPIGAVNGAPETLVNAGRPGRILLSGFG